MNAPEKIRCDACPVICCIAPGGRYGTLGGRVVPTAPVILPPRPHAVRAALHPPEGPR